MSRELKFRAWDKRMKIWVATGFHLMGEVMCFRVIEGHFFANMCGAETSLERWDDIEITQFTGLVDKMGKEIYEGDIVRVCLSDDPEDLEWEVSEVVFDNGAFSCGKLGMDYLADYIMDGKCDLEVIGNKFESPELLK